MENEGKKMNKYLLSIIPKIKHVSKYYLSDMTGFEGRVLRRQLAEIRKKYPLVNLANGKGYIMGTKARSKREMEIQLKIYQAKIDTYTEYMKPIVKELRYGKTKTGKSKVSR